MANKQILNNTREIIKTNIFNTIQWKENITVLDLSDREITKFDESVKLPQNLLVLNLSKNKFTEVPNIVLILDKLKTLDLSNNNIVLFDETPSFCHTLETLNLSKNQLQGPPYWVWVEQPKNLVNLNLSDNNSLCQSLDDYYVEDLLQYTCLVNRIDLHNCRLSRHMKLISTLKQAKVLNLGNPDYNYMSVNHIETVPCCGLEDCSDIEVLNLCNTHIYNIQHNIDIYKYLIEINLSQNNINSLPNEFCNLDNLEICILSDNKILYLPDDIYKLKKLTKLCLDNNDLCMLPENFCQLTSLKILDLYDNHLYESLVDISHLELYDVAQNYLDEPNNVEYLEKKRKLRVNITGRLDGRAPEEINEASETQEISDEDSEYCAEDGVTEQQEVNASRCSSPEDWDSDDYWIPSHVDIISPSSYVQNNRCTSSTSPTAMQWLAFVKRKMAEGNFCPMDMHLTISITDMVKYEKMHNPQPQYESDGQFDDYSDDDS